MLSSEEIPVHYNFDHLTVPNCQLFCTFLPRHIKTKMSFQIYSNNLINLIASQQSPLVTENVAFPRFMIFSQAQSTDGCQIY